MALWYSATGKYSLVPWNPEKLSGLIFTPLNQLNYNDIATQQLIILNELKNIPNPLLTALRSFKQNGGSLVIIPAKESNLASYNELLKNKVKKVGILLANYPQTVVGVAGFTDNDGSFEYNQKLSQKRASTVSDLLAVNGRPFTKGCSYNKAIVPNTSSKNKALNRRVEVYLYANQSNMTDPCR